MSQNGIFLSSFPSKTFNYAFYLYKQAYVHLTLLNLSNLLNFIRSTNCVASRRSIYLVFCSLPSLLGPNILISTAFSRTIYVLQGWQSRFYAWGYTYKGLAYLHLYERRKNKYLTGQLTESKILYLLK